MKTVLMLLMAAAMPTGHYLGEEKIGPGGGTMVGDLCFKDNVATEWGTACDGATDADCQWDGDSLNCRGATEYSGPQCAAGDSVSYSWGAGCEADCYQEFDGTDLQVYCPGATNGIVYNTSQIVGPHEWEPDSGILPCQFNVPLTAAGTSDGDKQAVPWCYSETMAFQPYAEADGNGGVDVLGVEFGAFNGARKRCTSSAPQTLTFAANPGDASKTTSGLIPDGATDVAIVGYTTVAGTNCTSVDWGDGTDVDLYANNHALTVGTTVDPGDYTAALDWNVTAASEVTLTGVGGNCFDLAATIIAFYCEYTANTE